MDHGYEVSLISSAPLAEGVVNLPGLKKLIVIPLAGTGGRATAEIYSERQLAGRRGSRNQFRELVKRRFGPTLRMSLGGLELLRKVGPLEKAVSEIGPDLVHAMRIPFEGCAIGLSNVDAPVLVSVWGNDLTLWARHYPVIAALTRNTLGKVDALHTDCERDLVLARRWGFDSSKPAIVAPGSGGVRTEIFFPGEVELETIDQMDVISNVPIVLNARGIRSYVNSRVFFEAIPIVLAKYPGCIFVAVAMRGRQEAEGWVRKLGIEQSVRLLPHVSQEEMAKLMRAADVTVSLSSHDGTPNTLLEAMACDCVPVVGDVESIHEWIEDGSNGLICTTQTPSVVAAKIIEALENDTLRQSAISKNRRLIQTRATHRVEMRRVAQFYEKITQ